MEEQDVSSDGQHGGLDAQSDTTPWRWPEDGRSPPAAVLFFDQECLVVNKPGGLLTQAPAGIPSIESQARQFFSLLAAKSGEPPQSLASTYVGVPHRLDRSTSGALLLGQSKPVTRKLAQQFEKRTVRKIYWALLEGVPENAQGTWTDWMRKAADQAISEIVAADDPEAQWAELDYRVLANSEQYSLVEILLKTGRTHQIRLQASTRGFPIIGDSWYGSGVAFGPTHTDERLRSIGLHARTIDFWHPRQHGPVVVTAPLPDTWIEFLTEHAPSIKDRLHQAGVL